MINQIELTSKPKKRHVHVGSLLFDWERSRDSKRSCSLMQSPQELVESCDTLASLPEVYLRVREVVNDPTSDSQNLANAISIDPAISARVLKLVNSPFYGFPRQVDTIFRAASILGMQPIHDLVLATSVTGVFAGMSQTVKDMRAFWADSVFCGLVAREVAKRGNVDDSERLFVLGLLRDIGHLVMYEKIPELCQAAIIRSQQEHKMLAEIEREVIGFDFAEVGALLIEKWNLTETIRVAIGYHLKPCQTKAFTLETSILHVAGTLTDSLSRDLQKESSPEFGPEVLDPIGISNEDLPDIVEVSTQELSGVFDLVCQLA